MTLGEGRKHLPPEVRAKLATMVKIVMNGHEKVTLSRKNVESVIECAAVYALMHVNLIGDHGDYEPYSWLDKS